MSEKLSRDSIAPEPALRPAWLGLASGAVLVVLGLAVMTGWLLRLPSLLQVFPGHVTMVFATALCFALAGAAY